MIYLHTHFIKKDILNFKTSLDIDDNPLQIKLLNFWKNKASIQLEGSKQKKSNLF